MNARTGRTRHSATAVAADEPRLPAIGAGEVAIVVPAYNEVARIGATVRSLLPHFPDVLVVDDGSSDGTSQAARTAGANVARHPINRGQGAALQTGILWARRRGFAYVVTFDADGQHDPADLDSLLTPLREGSADFALGSRFLGSAEGIPALRRWILRAAVHFSRLSSGLPVSDAHNGLRAMTLRGARMIDLQLDRMAHASEILDQIYRSRLPWTEIPVTVRYSADSLAKGQSSWSAVKILFDYLFARWFR